MSSWLNTLHWQHPRIITVSGKAQLSAGFELKNYTLEVFNILKIFPTTNRGHTEHCTDFKRKEKNIMYMM